MGEILSIRLTEGEKAQWEKAAAAVQETVAEYVRNAVRQRAQAANSSVWDQHLGSVNVAVPAPTNTNIRRSFSEHRRRKA